MSKTIDSLEVFYAHALAIETEAAERYSQLADVMDAHNNRDVADLFRWLCSLESQHAGEISRRSEAFQLPGIPAWEYRWQDAESPESVSHEDTHYRMTAYQALRMALAGEQGAVRFFEHVAGTSPVAEVRSLAATYAAEEQEHVGHVLAALSRHLPPSDDWDEDLDPPVPVE